MDLIARFDRGPQEEIRASLVNRDGQTYLELRVWNKLGAREQEPFPSAEGIRVPLALFGKLARAIQAVEVALRRRNLLPGEAPEVTQMVGGAPAAVRKPAVSAPPAVAVGGQPLGRTDPRVQVDCPVDYAIRSRQKPARPVVLRRGRTKDISRSGAQVVLPERVPILTALQLTLYLPVGDITLPCEVVWALHPAGGDIVREGCRHGLRFTQVGAAEHGLLDRLVNETTRQAGASPS
ncbi:MAG TPA: PilZ domain-containing protein [Candidatus Sulfotelmatobacter sp.]|nr:PilZ domain-containing protein [Candidatus Sulfotelmatobacter sp.]